MNATIYGRGQMVIPARARKEARINSGDVVDVRTEGDGRIVLIRLQRPAAVPPAKVRFIKRKGRHTVATTGRSITELQIKAALNDFP
jgi:AbrB family looped-hinge helix DNA binding protein